MATEPPKKRTSAGRPKKSEIAQMKENRGVGRPKGTQAIINEYRDRMLNSPKSGKVLEAIFDVALDTEHKHWAAAAKLVTDRIIPMSVFDASQKSGSVPQISISISGLNEPKVETVEEYSDVNIKEYKEDDSTEL